MFPKRIMLLRQTYVSWLLSNFSNGLVAYWPLTADSGNADLGPSGYTLTPTAITYTASPFGLVSTYALATQSRFAIPEAIENTLNFNLGTMLIWWLHDAATWSDSNYSVMLQIGEDINNRFSVGKGNIANRYNWFRAATGSGAPNASSDSSAAWAGVWNCSVSTWNSASTADQFVYVNGVPMTITNNAAAWTGGINAYRSIGALGAGAGQLNWRGSLAHIAIWNRVLSAAEITALYAKGWA